MQHNTNTRTRFDNAKASLVATALLLPAGIAGPAFAAVDPNITAATENSGAVVAGLQADATALDGLIGTLIKIALVVTAVVVGHRIFKRVTAQAG